MDEHDAARTLAKWLNEEHVAPIDRVALATVLTAWNLRACDRDAVIEARRKALHDAADDFEMGASADDIRSNAERLKSQPPDDRIAKDAARYRWLRDSSVGPSQIWELLSDDCNPPIMTLKSMHDLDAAIDQAMQSEGGK